MIAILQFLLHRQDPERGASLVEYALLVGLIAIVCVGALTSLGGSVSHSLSSGGSSMFGG